MDSNGQQWTAMDNRPGILRLPLQRVKEFRNTPNLLHALYFVNLTPCITHGTLSSPTGEIPLLLFP